MMSVNYIVKMVCAGALVLMPYISQAAFVSGSTGVDGDFAPTANVAVQIPESGILNYGTVTIPAGVTITFKKNTQNTPITILATGDVTVNGAISVNGSNGNYLIPGAGGAGGFDGGQGGAAYNIGKRGEGPGGGSGGLARIDQDNAAGNAGGGGFAGNGGTGGAYGWAGYPAGAAGGSSYGNEKIIPQIGGSGGGGGGGSNTYVGGGAGGGGGAIVIASSSAILISGSVTANGGNGANGEATYTTCNGVPCEFKAGGGGGGSGGSIRLIANTISGNGTLSAGAGGGGRGTYASAGAGSVGRIRLEASNVLRTAATSPPMSLGYPYAVVPQNMPTLAITSIGGMDVPAVPKGAYGSPDVMLPFNIKNPITVVVTGTNIPTGQTVTIKAAPSVGSATTASGVLSGTDTSSSASLSLSIATAYPSLITASVTFQVAALNGGSPIYFAGEKVEFVRVAANLGGGSTVTYITASGKEVPAVL